MEAFKDSDDRKNDTRELTEKLAPGSQKKFLKQYSTFILLRDQALQKYQQESSEKYNFDFSKEEPRETDSSTYKWTHR